jgi:hypothetical protein
MHILIFTLILLFACDAIAAGCGSRGGPGFRAADGKCVGWKDLDRKCGTPPTTHCSHEGAGIGDTALGAASSFIAAGVMPGLNSAPSFKDRATRVEGIACASPVILTRIGQCALTITSPTSKVAADDALAKGECVKLAAGTDATVEAGSHSFSQVRIKAKGQPRELWVDRKLVLE